MDERGERRALIREMVTATAAIRWHTAAARLAWALRRAAFLERRYGFDPAQPRLPRGVFGGGRWTDDGGLPAGIGGALDARRGPRQSTEGPRFAQARGGRNPSQRVTVDVGGLRLPATPTQQARFEAARLWADW